jgi:BolA protein
MRIMKRVESIKQKLSVLNPHYLKIIDQTSLHASHIPKSSEETHLKIEISAQILDRETTVKQHRLINKILEDEFKSGLHALSIVVKKTSDTKS